MEGEKWFNIQTKIFYFLSISLKSPISSYQNPSHILIIVRKKMIWKTILGLNIFWDATEEGRGMQDAIPPPPLALCQGEGGRGEQKLQCKTKKNALLLWKCAHFSGIPPLALKPQGRPRMFSFCLTFFEIKPAKLW